MIDKKFSIVLLTIVVMMISMSSILFASTVDAVTYRSNTAHTGQATMPDFTPPIDIKWDVDLKNAVSYPLISNNTIYLYTGGSTLSLYALNAKNGALLWGPSSIPLSSVAGIAYENGKIFIAGIGPNDNIPAMLVGFDATNGAYLWSTTLSGQWDYTGAPTALNGNVYTQGAGNINCVRESDGTLLWASPQLETMDGALAVTNNGLYVAGACGDTYSLNQANGNILWSLFTGCEGGGGYTVSFYNGYLFVNDYYSSTSVSSSLGIVNASTGKLVTILPNMGVLAFDNNLVIGTHNSSIIATKTSDWSNAWTVNDAVNLPGTAPTIINGVAYVGTQNGYLIGYNENTGVVQTKLKLNEVPSVTSDSHCDMSAGNGILVIPAGTHLIAVGTPFAQVGCTLNPASPNGTNGWYTRTVNATLTTTAGTIYYTLDGGSQLTYTSPISITSDAVHNLIYWASDTQGNVTSKKTQVINIDATAPTTTTKVSGNQLVTGAYSGSASITLSATDSQSGVLSTHYNIDGGADTTYTVPFTVTGAATHTITYYSIDKAGNTEAKKTLSVDISPTILNTFSPGLQMISAPQDFTGISLSKYIDVTPVTLASWNPITLSYIMTPTAPDDTIHLCQGYWVKFNTSADILDLGVNSDTSKVVNVNLSRGWNMIGNPRKYDIALASLNVLDSHSNSYPVGINGSLVSNILYTYQPGDTAYETITGSVFLKTYEGYWIYAYQNCILQFPANPVNPPTPPSNNKKHK